MVANGLTSEKIKVGQQLLVPYDIPTTKPLPPSPLEDISSIYTVKKGDTLFSLAKKYKITVHELKKANNIKTDQIYVGQSILVPSEFHSELIEEEMYTVVPGDTLISQSDLGLQ